MTPELSRAERLLGEIPALAAKADWRACNIKLMSLAAEVAAHVHASEQSSMSELMQAMERSYNELAAAEHAHSGDANIARVSAELRAYGRVVGAVQQFVVKSQAKALDSRKLKELLRNTEYPEMSEAILKLLSPSRELSGTEIAGQLDARSASPDSLKQMVSRCLPSLRALGWVESRQRGRRILNKLTADGLGVTRVLAGAPSPIGREGGGIAGPGGGVTIPVTSAWRRPNPEVGAKLQEEA